MRDDTLWAEIYALDFLKKAILLYCLSPNHKQDMIHVGIVSSHGEGKDHLIERVIQPLVPCRRAGSGKMATIPGLFGAMSGDDLNSIEIGLLPKMNHERVKRISILFHFYEFHGQQVHKTETNQIFTFQASLPVLSSLRIL